MALLCFQEIQTFGNKWFVVFSHLSLVIEQLRAICDPENGGHLDHDVKVLVCAGICLESMNRRHDSAL